MPDASILPIISQLKELGLVGFLSVAAWGLWRAYQSKEKQVAEMSAELMNIGSILEASKVASIEVARRLEKIEDRLPDFKRS